ncbi:MAG: efflux RND transporter periplasmic adaptor subunit [Deltaproteobacteria bacterium]|nr:efflux RND transporter periplasmic adaptor subunit [Deltaproteobacteria bacterium]
MKRCPMRDGDGRLLLLYAGRGLILALGLLFILQGCSVSETQSDTGEKPARSKASSVPVSVATTSRKDMPVEVQAVGSVEPFAAVGIKSQVAGVLVNVNFREGDPVKAGDLLFRIDPRPFDARLHQALAALAEDRAALDNARRQAARYRPAAEKGYVSEEQSDQAQTSVAVLAAAVAAEEAAVESARLDLDNCTIRSPISGYTGVLLVDQGNLVKAEADQPLVTINQVQPIKVCFALSEQALPELKKYLAAGSLAVQAVPVGYCGEPLVGRISFLDNMVDAATGTIRLKATFANPDRILWPGQFVHVRLQLTTRRDATVVPARAVQTSQTGNFVYLVDPEQRVELRPVTLGFSVGDESVIERGLAVGETVVTDGQLRLAPGVKVRFVQADTATGKTEATQ